MSDRLISARHWPIYVVVIAAVLLAPLAARGPTFGAENPEQGGGYLQASKPTSQSNTAGLARPGAAGLARPSTGGLARPSTGGLASLYPGDEGIERDPHPESRVMEVWFDDIVIATEYIGPIHGKPKNGKKIAVPSRSALLTPGLLITEPGDVAYSQNFEEGPGGFKGGAIQAGGIDGSKAYACGASGCSIWDTYSVPVKDSTTVRFKLKALSDINDVQILIWSKKLKDNCRYKIGPLRKGQTRDIEFRAIEAHVGWGMDGPSLEGCTLDNFKLIFEGNEDARIVLDNFEIHE